MQARGTFRAARISTAAAVVFIAALLGAFLLGGAGTANQREACLCATSIQCGRSGRRRHTDRDRDRERYYPGSHGQMHPELVLDLSRPYPGTMKGDWPIFKSLLGLPKTAKGCIGFQVDGASFQEWIVVST